MPLFAFRGPGKWVGFKFKSLFEHRGALELELDFGLPTRLVTYYYYLPFISSLSPVGCVVLFVAPHVEFPSLESCLEAEYGALVWSFLH